jgi:hypothetical protein
MTLPLPPSTRGWYGAHCDICATTKDLVVTLSLCSDPPRDVEWRCNHCIKAVHDATEQRRGTNASKS